MGQTPIRDTVTPTRMNAPKRAVMCLAVVSFLRFQLVSTLSVRSVIPLTDLLLSWLIRQFQSRDRLLIGDQVKRFFC